MQSYLKKICVLVLLLASSPFVDAAVPIPAWQIVPKDSSLTFTATQNNAPVTGTFKSFSGEINFDPNQLNDSRVNINVDTGSIFTSDPEIADNLKKSDWFDAKLFPRAVFKAAQFSKTGKDKTGKDIYQAKGTLTIRNKTQPATLTFVLEEYSATKARVKGEVTLQRNAFEVGKGEWATESVVKNNVVVNFKVSAVKK